MCVYDLPRVSDWASNVTKSESPSNDNDNKNSNAVVPVRRLVADGNQTSNCSGPKFERQRGSKISCVYDLPRGSDWAYNIANSESPSNDNDNNSNLLLLLLLSLSLLGDADLVTL